MESSSVNDNGKPEMTIFLENKIFFPWRKNKRENKFEKWKFFRKRNN